MDIALEVLENILLFIPLGFLLKQFKCGKKWIVIGCLVLSVLVELAQLIFHLGLFEFDDILDNALGAFIGVFIGEKIKISDVKKVMLSSVVVLCSVVFCIVIPKLEREVVEKKFFFEIKSYDIVDDLLTLDGYCFIYEMPEMDYSLMLVADDNTVSLRADKFLQSDDINTYFLCKEDYSSTGFSATAEIDFAATYEIMVKWENGITSSTGTYIRNGKITYSISDAPAYTGTLLVAEPAHDFYVYQNDGYVYWLCGPTFPFEDDGLTYIQYQLWTTQTENLPKNRLSNGNLWDNIGFTFEDNEIEAWNGYRVAKRPIPQEYSITAIVTGYYKGGKWIWKDYFRPIIFYIPRFPLMR